MSRKHRRERIRIDRVRVDTSNANGSTNTRVRRFTTLTTSYGSAITYTDSATAGAEFTINANGIYSIDYSDAYGAAANMGISVNSSQLTTDIQSITTGNRLVITSSAGADYHACASWTGRLNAGDVIRAHTGAVTTNGATNVAVFSIIKISN